jgi:predicted PurR-regulated permease PerM
MEKESLNKRMLLLVVLFISAVFVAMIRQFLMAIILAGIFTALSKPLYNRLQQRFGNRSALASLTTILLIVCVILLPMAGLLGIVAAQAVKVSELARPWIEQHLSEPGAFLPTIESLPFYDTIEPYKNEILKKAGGLVGDLSGFIFTKISSLTLGTMNLIFSMFVMLYCMFFFLMDGEKLLDKILYYLPLQDEDERRILERFTSVSRATIKGTLVIGILQGGLAGAAFWVAGIPSAVFWGAIMAVLSIIPSIGSALIWAPAAIILMATGHLVSGVLLVLFCGVVVGSLDNLLRPVLVGKDTQMHELMIFFGTLGGIFMFGLPGLVIGPIAAALFVTVWDIYGIAFADVLPKVRKRQQEEIAGDAKDEEDTKT